MIKEFSFDDLGTNGNLAIVDRSGNYEWVEPTISSVPSESCVRVELLVGNGGGDEDARALLQDHIEENYMVDLPCDFRDDADISRAVSEAVAIRDRFLAGDRTPLSAHCESAA